jgi:predicted metal-dependent HD superfamily phosphohydrolase
MFDPQRHFSGRHPGWASLVAAGFAPARIDDVLALYDEPHRIYHDRRHVQQMLEEAARLAVRLTAAQALALLFHDAVYVPGAAHGANEALSAQLLRRYGGGLDPRLVDEAAAVVVDTAGHLPSRASAAIVLDLDLLRLAAPAEAFERYSRDVYSELRPLLAPGDDRAAWQQFTERRARFFSDLLARPSIYATPLFRRRFEAVARANLQAAIGGQPIG